MSLAAAFWTDIVSEKQVAIVQRAEDECRNKGIGLAGRPYNNVSTTMLHCDVLSLQLCVFVCLLAEEVKKLCAAHFGNIFFLD